MNTLLKYLLTTICAVCCTAETMSAQSFTNNNPEANVVPYGGTFTYSVSWGSGGANPLELLYLYCPFGTKSLDALFPNPGTFTYTINGVTGTDQGSYQISSGYPNQSAPVRLYIAPAILIQPQTTICVSGGSTAMGMACGPANVTTFQWFDSATDIAISSATNTPMFTPTTETNEERIYCQLFNDYGEVTSSNALLTVGTAPAITVQPTNVLIVSGSSATFTVTATGTGPLYYQWYQDGFVLQGANMNYITLPSSNNLGIETFTVLVSNLFGQTTSAIATLITGGAPQALSATLENDSSVNLQAIGTPGVTYVLQVTTNLISPNWQSVVTNSTDTNGVWSFLDTNTQLCPAKFYRIITP